MKKIVIGFFMTISVCIIFCMFTLKACATEITVSSEQLLNENLAKIMDVEVPVEMTELTQNTDEHTFSNSSDGSFKYKYAVNSDYYRGKAVDESTGIKYIFISYNDKIWAVVYSKKGGFEGTYDTTSFISAGSSDFDSITTKTQLKIKKNKTGNIYLKQGFYYSDDFSIITTGFSLGIYYEDGCPKQGLTQIDDDYFYFIDGVYQVDYYKKVGKYGYYFGSDGKAVRRQWINVDNCLMYFGAKGRNIKTYYTEAYEDSEKTGMYKIYKKGKWNWVEQGIYKINDTYKYFKDGKIYTSTCWYNADSNTSYYIKNGTVLYNLKANGNSFILYKIENNNWVIATDTWSPAKKGVLMYFDSSGTLVYKYFNSKYRTTAYRDTVWKYKAKKNKWVKCKNQLVKIKGYYYYTSSTGTLYKTKGWLTISDTSAVYINAAGKVSRYIYYDETKGCSIYKFGVSLSSPDEGLITVKINGQKVYYYVDSNGESTSGSRSVDGYIYDFDEYGRAYSRRIDGILYWNTDEWFERVITEYLGVGGMYCNVFVDQAFALAGGSDPSIKLALKYESPEVGGILLDTDYMCSDWAENSRVTGMAVLSDGTDWKKSESIVLNSNIVDFSYDDLSPGDVILYYKDSCETPSHISLYLGRFENKTAVVEYLVSIGVSEEAADSYVKDWGQYYDNESTYWCIHGGMGDNNQVYISNSTHCIPASGGYTYGTKIVNVID